LGKLSELVLISENGCYYRCGFMLDKRLKDIEKLKSYFELK
jgi:hypothetical protein